VILTQNLTSLYHLELPNLGLLDTIVSVFIKYVSEGKCEFNDLPYRYTHVKEKVMLKGNEYSIVVGGFYSAGLRVDCSYDYDDVGVAGARKSIDH